MPANDLELVRRAKDGDTAAFEELVIKYQTRIYNLALRMTSNREDALDLSQEIFLRVYKALPLFKEQSAFSTWVYSIASNMCIDFVRKQKKSRHLSMTFSAVDREETVLDVPDTRYQPDSEYEKTELRRQISDGLDNLSPEHREILVMRELWGLSYSEICDALDIEAGTVKSRISRARGQLSAFLRNKMDKKPSNQKEGR